MNVHPSVVHMLRAAADAEPDRVALRCGDEAFTYADYLGSVDEVAGRLARQGAGNARVAILMANSADICVAIFAAQQAGAQVVPLNPAYTAHELGPILADAEPAIILHDESLSPVVDALADRLGIPERIAVGPGRRLARHGLRPGFDGALPAPEDLSTLQYTGGTTGRAKGVNLTHRAVSTNVAQRSVMLPAEDGARVLVVTPLYHSYALAMGLYLAADCRGTLTVLPRFRPDWTLDAIGRDRIQLFAGAPTLYVGLLGFDGFRSADLSSLTLCFSGSAPLSTETLSRWEAATGCPICEGYGQSEAGPILTYNPRHGPRKVGSAGIPVPDTEVEIVDPETGTRPLAAGEIGEIRARGPQVMAGYRNRADETAAALRSGWLHTGDLGSLDRDGFLFVHDRKKDMVLVGGFNVYPREIEEVLFAHPAVAEAAVIGVPDPYRGEVLRAYVVVRDGTPTWKADLEAHLAERLTRYKLPRDIERVATLPKTPVGKIDKVALRAASSAAAT